MSVTTATVPARANPGPPTHLGAPLRDLLRPFRARLVVAAAAVLAAAALDLVPPLVIGHVIDAKLTTGRTDGLGVLAASYLAAVAAVQALTAGYSYLAATVAQRSLAVIRGRLFAHLLDLPAAYHDRTPVGDSISRCTADLEAIDDLFSSSATRLLGDTARLGTVAAAMLLLSPTLTAAAALVLPPLILLTTALRRRIRDAERDTRVALGALNTQIQEDLSGVEVIRAFGREEEFANRFGAALTTWLRAVNRSTRANAFFTPGVGLLAALATALLLWLGAHGTLGPAGVSVGTLTAFVLLLARFFTPLAALGEEWQKVQGALAGAERVFSVLAVPVDPETPIPPQTPAASAGVEAPRFVPSPQSTPIADLEGEAVTMDDVTFGYQADLPVLHSLNLVVRPGEHLAIVGATGSGKSTMLNLLAGLYGPQHGRIRVAGRDPRTVPQAERRTITGFVPQTSQLFIGTVYENLTLGDPSLNPEEVHHAAALAGADRFVEALPDGYHTLLSDTARGYGAQLSAGQRQLLALARALASRPAVLLLDEATATIDGASEAAFRTALSDRVTATGTAVVSVAHKLATARHADQVIVLARGRIAEHGTPADLLATGGLFATLAALDDAGWDWEHDASWE